MASKGSTSILWVVGLSCALLPASCQRATQARLVVRTNVEYRAGLNVAVWAGGSAPVTASSDAWLQDGNIGDLVITPRRRTSEPLSLRVAMGLGRDAASCSDADSKGCIIAKRQLAFVPNEGLRVPVVLHLACVGVSCGDNATCNYLGKCVSAAVDANACTTSEGCSIEGDDSVTRTLPNSNDAGDTSEAQSDVGTLDTGPTESGVDAGTDTGVDAASTPLPFPLLVASNEHSCARLDNGSVKCWGDNGVGQLGLGDTMPRGTTPASMGAALPPVDLGPGRTVIGLYAGFVHTCALFDDGSVKCWGANFAGQLGLGDLQHRGDNAGEMGANLPTVDLGPGRTALSLAGGSSHTCAILDNGSVKCWGAGSIGLGDANSRGGKPGEMGANLPAVDLGPNRTAMELEAGQDFTCARLDNGSVKCWGSNLYGQLGLGDTSARGNQAGQMGVNLPVVDLGLGRTASRLAGGTLHACALLDDRAVKCWGWNPFGQLGVGDVADRGKAPGQMGANLPAVDLAGFVVSTPWAGEGHTCVKDGTGDLKCWGYNDDGQLGLGDNQRRGNTPASMGANLPSVDFGAGRSVVAISTGRRHNCARLDDGTIRCWGYNGAGHLGLGDTTSRGIAPGQMGAALPAVQLQ